MVGSCPCQSWAYSLCKCPQPCQCSYFQILHKSQNVRVQLSSMQKLEEWLSAKPHLTHGSPKSICFDECSLCSPQQPLQVLAPDSDSQPHMEIIPSTFCPYSNHRNLNSLQGSGRSSHHAITGCLPLSLTVPPELPHQRLFGTSPSVEEASGHREEGVLFKDVASDPQKNQLPYSVPGKYIFRNTCSIKVSYIELFMMKCYNIWDLLWNYPADVERRVRGKVGKQLLFCISVMGTWMHTCKLFSTHLCLNSPTIKSQKKERNRQTGKRNRIEKNRKNRKENKRIECQTLCSFFVN